MAGNQSVEVLKPIDKVSLGEITSHRGRNDSKRKCGLETTSLDFHGTEFASQMARSNAHFSSLLAPKLLCESVR